MNNKTITVNGVGTASVKPDLIILNMSVDTLEYDYSTAINQATEDINTLKQALIAVGYKADDLKTTDFSVNTSYEGYKDESDVWQQRFNGYKCTHRLKLEFDLNMTELNKVLNAILSSSVTPVFSISFSVKDTASVAEQLLVNAVDNATRKADILAKASKVKLGAIINIDYSWKELHLYSDMRIAEPMCYASDAVIDVTPEDIKASDTVTIIWEIC